jgi:hypothetical protein
MAGGICRQGFGICPQFGTVPSGTFTVSIISIRASMEIPSLNYNGHLTKF